MAIEELMQRLNAVFLNTGRWSCLILMFLFHLSPTLLPKVLGIGCHAWIMQLSRDKCVHMALFISLLHESCSCGRRVEMLQVVSVFLCMLSMSLGTSSSDWDFQYVRIGIIMFSGCCICTGSELSILLQW